MDYVFNHQPDTQDTRDIKLSSHLELESIIVPRSVDLRLTEQTPPILNQGKLGACAGNQLSNCLRFCLEKHHQSVFQPSRLFIYYFGRLLDNSDITKDTGITLRSGLKSIEKYGTPTELEVPYRIQHFAKEPTKQAKINALKYIKNFRYLKIDQTELEIKKCLVSGYPIVLGIQVYKSFYDSLQTGKVGLPKENDTKLGGHCVSLYGYNDMTREFLMMNTWGSDVGQKGWFYIGYDYILNNSLAFDLWTIQFY